MPSYRNLQEGYRALKSCVDALRGALQSDLACRKQVSATDEVWLDMEAILIDEKVTLTRMDEKWLYNTSPSVSILPLNP